MNNPYRDWIQALQRWWQEGTRLPPAAPSSSSEPSPEPGRPRALFFAPHPDDETITGALALRLMREAGLQVVDIAVTLGSRKERRAARLAELRQACRQLGFGLELIAPEGLEGVTPQSRQADPARWQRMVQQVAQLLTRHQPRVLFCPHDRDSHATHSGTHYLVLDALREVAPSWDCHVIETEFWAPMEDPNLMVEVSPELLADLIAATTCHRGEIERNPYHLRLPAWMMDNVRRGTELIAGFGTAAPPFLFAQLFRLRRWAGNGWAPDVPAQKLLPADVPAGTLLGPETGSA